MGKRLLVVDSDRRFIQDHKSQMESAFDVDFLYATEGALTQLESGQYGALLLCVETSENKGYALCSAIRRSAQLQDLKIALISAKASEEEYARHRQTKGKADLYLHKPVTSSVLIPALADLVPMKEDDPDNPLGDLGGADLGEEWLESLRSELETEPPAPAPATVTPAPGWPAPPLAERPSPRNEGEVELLEWRVRDLEQKLTIQQDEIERKNREIEELLQRHAAVTRNLDEAQHVHAESERLRQGLTERDETITRLKEDLEGALAEARRAADSLEEKDVLLQEKTQKNAELMETHQLLQAQVEEAWEAADKAKAAQAALSEAQQALQDLEARATQAERSRDDAASERDMARLELDGLKADRVTLEARIQELEASRARMEELDRELVSCREQVSFQELTIRNLAEERSQLHAERERQEEALAGRSGEVLALQEKVALVEGASQDAVEERDRLRETRAQLEGSVADLESHIQGLEAGFAAQRHELMAGIEQREAGMADLSASMDGLREDLARLEREKGEALTLAQARLDRLQAVTTVLADLEGKARQALDLARSVTD